jgi:hypothetical protein
MFIDIICSLKAGKIYVMREGYRKTSLSMLVRRLKKSGVNVRVGIAGKNQYALFAKKD